MKYMGSKSRIKKNIVPLIQNLIYKNNINTYIEPFCGGCNVIDDIDCSCKFANDNNHFLVALLSVVSEDGSDILPKEVPKELYDDVRDNVKTNKHRAWYTGAIGFLASYNGRFFDGGYAKTLISKDGKLRNYYDESKRNLTCQINKLKEIEFTTGDFLEFDDLDSGPLMDTLIYCDIPYKDTKQYNTSKDFPYELFWKWARRMSKDNIVLISELQAPNDFKCIWEQEITRTQNNRSREKSTEKLFIYNAPSRFIYE